MATGCNRSIEHCVDGIWEKLPDHKQKNSMEFFSNVCCSLTSSASLWKRDIIILTISMVIAGGVGEYFFKQGFSTVISVAILGTSIFIPRINRSLKKQLNYCRAIEDNSFAPIYIEELMKSLPFHFPLPHDVLSLPCKALHQINERSNVKYFPELEQITI